MEKNHPIPRHHGTGESGANRMLPAELHTGESKSLDHLLTISRRAIPVGTQKLGPVRGGRPSHNQECAHEDVACLLDSHVSLLHEHQSCLTAFLLYDHHSLNTARSRRVASNAFCTSSLVTSLFLMYSTCRLTGPA